ncbi:MAG: TIGR02757 family protein [Bacteroidales bacterium]
MRNDIDIKMELDSLAQQHNTPELFERDPIALPKRYTDLQDIEISALITSVVSWGKREMIFKNANKIDLMMGSAPFSYIMSRKWETLNGSRVNLHRTFFESDLYTICASLYDYYLHNETLEDLFLDGITNGIDRLSDMIGSKHISSTKRGGPAKRTNMMLRWLVRNDGIVDMGVWKRVSPSELIIPLDTHVSQRARQYWHDLPKTDRLATALRITEKLRDLSPEDPCIYDFALFGEGFQNGSSK